VRDLLLGIKPKDYDIATNARPREVSDLFPKAKGVGKRFGVSVVSTKAGDCEVAAFRKDGEYFDHRRPAWVNYADLAEDALRRDFTINALYYDPHNGEIIDLVDGRSDLEKRVLRIIGDPFERFDEDWLRIFRAVRFAVRFRLKFDPRTWEGLRTLSPMVKGVIPERRTDEIRRMLQGPFPGRAVGLFHKTGIWQTLWPEIPFNTRRVRQSVNLLKKNTSRAAIWAHLFADLPEELVARVCGDLRLTRAERKALGIA
jgi:poly(A) polymerase